MGHGRGSVLYLFIYNFINSFIPFIVKLTSAVGICLSPAMWVCLHPFQKTNRLAFSWTGRHRSYKQQHDEYLDLSPEIALLV